MATIGTFTKKDGKFTGTIRTMTINVKAQIVPVKEKPSEAAPDYRVFAGGAELGAGWMEKGKDGDTPYLAVKLDDPSFDKPIRAAFFEDEAGKGGAMVWNRHTVH